MKVVVIIPTYNERENTAPLLSAVQEAAAGTGYDTSILVVDDNSPDGTAQVVQEVQQRCGNVHLLVGEKRGLRAAYVRGIRHAPTMYRRTDGCVRKDGCLFCADGRSREEYF